MMIFLATCRQRGLSLVEMMIVIVVVGILLGAVIVPLQALLSDNAYESEKQHMAQLRDAVVGYAVRYQTKKRVANIDGAGARVFNLPAGRPYLPCPDIDGDGYEDRHNVPLAINTDIESTVTLVVHSDILTRRVNNLLLAGSCLVSRGILPWKTLGVPAADYWGNRYTYQVDDAFANAIVGFNENTKADVFDLRTTVSVAATGDFLYSRRQTISTAVEKIDYRVITIVSPNATITNTVATTTQFEYVNSRRPIVVCEGTVALCQQQSTMQLVLAAGEIQKSTHLAPGRQYIAGDISDGIPFVIVSHGKNGHGAANHGANETMNSVAFSVLICNSPIRHSVSTSPMQITAYHYHEAVNFPQVEGPNKKGNFCPQLSFNSNSFKNGYFVTAPRTDEFFAGSNNDNFDDIVTWMTRDELVRALTDGLILPAVDIPVFKDY